MVQVPPAAMLPLPKLKLAAPATGLKIGEPQPEVEAFGGLATDICPGLTGNVSVNATPLSAYAAFGLVTVKDNVTAPLTGAALGVNVLTSTGGDSTSTPAVPGALSEVKVVVSIWVESTLPYPELL